MSAIEHLSDVHTAIAQLYDHARVLEVQAERTEAGIATLYEVGDSRDKILLAKLCDGFIDPSGALLGRVRQGRSAQ